MKKITIQNKELNIPDNWSEIKFEIYNRILKIYMKFIEDMENYHEDLFIVDFCSTVIGIHPSFFLDSPLTEEEIIMLYQLYEKFDINNVPKEKVTHFDINGKIYSYELPEKLTFGENISIKILQKNSDNVFDIWMDILTVLVRPAKELKNEFGETIYEVEKFNGDIETLRKRKELFKHLPAANALYIIEAFTKGRNSL